jgi:hypothetical protein
LSGKLIWLNLMLAGILAYGVVMVRNHWQSEKLRETATLGRKVPAAAAPPITPTPPPPALLPSGYVQIPGKLLFDRSRNSEVIVETPPPAPVTPPPPVPPLPAYHGQMNIGEPIVILSVNATAPGQPVKRGEQIGPFKLVDFNTAEIALEWNGQVIHKTVDDIMQAPAAAEEAAPQRTSAPPPPPSAIIQKPVTGPGKETGTGIKTCVEGDPSPEGAVVDNYRKVLKKLPFGSSCYWEPVN